MVAGARAQLANVVAAVFCFLTLVLLTPLFRDMPHRRWPPSLSPPCSTCKPECLRDLFRRSRWEFALAAVVVLAELTLGVLQGIALGAITFPGLLISRPGGDLFFASIGHFQDGLKSALITHPATRLLVDFESVNLIDTSACDVMLTAIKELQDQGVTVAFAWVRDEVRERMRLTGIESIVGANNFYERVTDGVRAYPIHRNAP